MDKPNGRLGTGKLHALLRFYIQPINQVVFLGPSGRDLILERASRLYAFSGYQATELRLLSLRPCRTPYTRGSSIPVLSY